MPTAHRGLMRKILSSILIIGVVGALAVGLSSAFFSDTETSTDNTFQAGSLDLKINSLDNPPAIVNVDDLKPGDDVFEEKILKIIDNPAFVWMHIKDLVDDQGTQTSPEIVDENLLGGPKYDLQNYLTYDLSVDNEIIIDFDDEILLPDAVSCWIPLGELPGNTDATVTQSFHFDEDVTDWAQGDTLTFTEEFYATQVRNNPNALPPDTGSGRVWDPESKICTDELDFLNVGDASSESTHSISGWGPVEPAMHGGGWGGACEDGNCRVIYASVGNGDGSAFAEFDMYFGGPGTKKLVFRNLNGISGADSFEIYIDNVLVDTIIDPNQGVQDFGRPEIWVDTEITGLTLTGTHTVKLESINPTWSLFSTYGQGAFTWVRVIPTPP